MIFFIFLLVMPKYGGGGISASGVSPKWVKSKRRKRRRKKRKERERERERLKAESSSVVL